MTASIHIFPTGMTPLEAARRTLRSPAATASDCIDACAVIDRYGSPYDQWIADQVRHAFGAEVIYTAGRAEAAAIKAARRAQWALLGKGLVAGFLIGTVAQWVMG